MKRCPNCQKQFLDDANFCPVDAGRLEPDPGATVAQGSATPEVTPVDSGLVAGRYRVGDRIDAGGTGAVHEAVDTANGDAACVVKLIDDTVFQSPLIRQRTERELKQLERVQSDNVVKVLGHGDHLGSMYVAMEKVPGDSLQALLFGGPIDVERARKIVIGLGTALADAAKVGVVHRDVAPKNVILDASDQVKVINFSLPATLNEHMHGVPEYLSPEQIEGKPVDQRSNIYSLGAVFYFMVTGTPPYQGDVESVLKAHLEGNAEPPTKRAEVSPAIEAIIMKALERTPSKRFMTLRQLLGDVERADTSGAADSASQTTPFPAGKAPVKAPARTMIGGFSVGVNPETGQPEIRETVPDQQGSNGVSQAPTVAPESAIAQPPQAAAAPAQAAPPQAAPPQAAPPQAAPPQAAPPQAAPPQAAPPQAAPPQAAPPQAQTPAPQPQLNTAAAPAGGKGRHKAEEAARKQKGKFRETMWFKKGELDAAAAEAAAAAQKTGQSADGLQSTKADEMIMEDRYTDDGSISTTDQRAFSLRTGHTQMMRAAGGDAGASSGMKEDELIDEMKGGRGKVIALIVAGLVLVACLIGFMVMRSGDESSDEDKSKTPPAAPAGEESGSLGLTSPDRPV